MVGRVHEAEPETSFICVRKNSECRTINLKSGRIPAVQTQLYFLNPLSSPHFSPSLVRPKATELCFKPTERKDNTSLFLNLFFSLFPLCRHRVSCFLSCCDGLGNYDTICKFTLTSARPNYSPLPSEVSFHIYFFVPLPLHLYSVFPGSSLLSIYFLLVSHL